MYVPNDIQINVSNKLNNTFTKYDWACKNQPYDCKIIADFFVFVLSWFSNCLPNTVKYLPLAPNKIGMLLSSQIGILHPKLKVLAKIYVAQCNLHSHDWLSQDWSQIITLTICYVEMLHNQVTIYILVDAMN